MQIILFLLVSILLAYQNNSILNLSKNQVIIVALISYYFFFMQKEKFTLTESVISNISSLVNDTFYDTGILDPTKQIQVVTQERNGGTPCGVFPYKVYKVTSPQPPVNATCRIGTSGPSVGPGAQAALAANLDSHYTFAANQTSVLGSSIKPSTTL